MGALAPAFQLHDMVESSSPLSAFKASLLLLSRCVARRLVGRRASKGQRSRGPSLVAHLRPTATIGAARLRDHRR